MKKFLLFTLAAFAFIACNKGEEKAPVVDTTLYTITVEGGEADVEDGKAAPGTVVTLIPDVLPDHHLAGSDQTGWMVMQGPDLKIRNDKFMMPRQNVVIRAIFDIDVYKVEAIDCTFSPSGDIPSGTIVKIKPNAPREGYKFGGWVATPEGKVTITEYVSEGVNPEGWTHQFVMPAIDVELKAEYALDAFVLDTEDCTARVYVDGAWSDYEPEQQLTVGTRVELTPTTPAGQVLIGWESEQVTVGAGYNFNMPGENVAVKALFEPEIAIPADSYPYILYWTGQRLGVGTYFKEVNTSNMLLTRFGSLVGFTLTGDGDTWGEGDIKFNASPLTTASLTADAYAFDKIPYMSLENKAENAQADYATAYHNDANNMAGKGDICKLVGLTEIEAKYLAATGRLDEYNSGYHLPTRNEMYDIYATGDPVNSGMEALVIGEDRGWGIPGDQDSFLPCIGIRFSFFGDGQPRQVGGITSFRYSTTVWDGTKIYVPGMNVQNMPASHGGEENLEFDGLSVATDTNGCPVRCVPNS